MATHDGHRQRLKKRFLEEGLDNFNEINVLELLLFYAIPRKDTNEIAHNLLDKFGGLEGVLDANASDLVKTAGISDNSAVFLSLISAVSRFYQEKKTELDGPMDQPDRYCAVFRPKFIGRRNEMVYVLCLDAKYKMICCRLVGEGRINSANISVRKIAEIALSVNATAIVLAHNHPSGFAVPSNEDIVATRHAAQVLQAMDIVLLDHVIAADNEVVSMRSSGSYQPQY